MRTLPQAAVLLLGMCLALAAGCGEPVGPADAGVDAADGGPSDGGPSDGGPIDGGPSDGGPSDGGATDGGVDAPEPFDGGMDAGVDAPDPLDTGMDAALEADAPVATDAGADAPDGGSDAGSDAPVGLPDTCTTSLECGPRATCDTSITPGRCVCNRGFGPCASGCCPVSLTREVVITGGGHAPELGFDDAGNVYVLYLVGSTSVRLAQIAPDDTFTTVTVGTCSSVRDAHDLWVRGDGTVHVALHTPLTGRSGDLRILTRAAGASSFTSRSVVLGGREIFAFDASVSISAAPSGDLYATASERSGDGTMGLYVARFDAAASDWLALPRAFSFDGLASAETFARDDVLFVGIERIAGAYNWWRMARPAGTESILSVSSTTATRGEVAGAMDDAGAFYALTDRTSSGVLTFSDGRSDELWPMPTQVQGLRTDADMAIDRDGHVALFVHSATTRNVGLMVRMPRGGQVLVATSPEDVFLPGPDEASWLSLDLERTTGGSLGVAIGDSMDRGQFVYREYVY